jgi:hypothetical protein
MALETPAPKDADLPTSASRGDKTDKLGQA